MSDDESEFNERINTMYQEERDALQAYFNSANIKAPIRQESDESPSTSNYTYPGLNLLDDDLEYCANNYEFGNIHICPYYITETEKMPFLQFILRKYDKNHETKSDLITFPSFEYVRNFPTMNFSNYILDVMHAAYKIKNGMYEYKGFVNKDNQFYVFYDFSKCVINVHDLYRMNDLWLVTMDEIMNHSKVCNFPLDPAVTSFFSDVNNIDFGYLKDRDGNIIETPIVGYIGASSRHLEFISCFGISETMQEKLPTPHYYFTDYQKAIKMAGWSNKDNVEGNAVDDNFKYSKGGIIRFALFVGDVKIYSENTKGDVKSSYDSMYIGSDDGHPLWALTHYDQQYPLTCHYINKTLLGKEWSNNDEYYVI